MGLEFKFNLLLKIYDKRSNKHFSIKNQQLDYLLVVAALYTVSFHIDTKQMRSIDYSYLEASIIQYRGELQVRRKIHLYENSPAVRHQFVKNIQYRTVLSFS